MLSILSFYGVLVIEITATYPSLDPFSETHDLRISQVLTEVETTFQRTIILSQVWDRIILNITVQNDGDADLEIGVITIDDTQFDITSGNISGDILQQTEWKEISLQYTPDSVGVHTATLSIPSNDTITGTVNVTLTGEGIIKPEIEVIPEPPGPIDFGDVTVFKVSGNRTVKITNIGIVDLDIGDIDIPKELLSAIKMRFR